MFCRHVFTEKGTRSVNSPLALPKHRQEIERLLQANDIVGVRAPTGAGKSREVTEMIAKEFLRKGEKTLLVTIRRAAAVSNHEVLIRDEVLPREALQSLDQSVQPMRHQEVS